jgi:hypothetical protein
VNKGKKGSEGKKGDKAKKGNEDFVHDVKQLHTCHCRILSGTRVKAPSTLLNGTRVKVHVTCFNRKKIVLLIIVLFLVHVLLQFLLPVERRTVVTPFNFCIILTDNA